MRDWSEQDGHDCEYASTRLFEGSGLWLVFAFGKEAPKNLHNDFVSKHYPSVLLSQRQTPARDRLTLRSVESTHYECQRLSTSSRFAWANVSASGSDVICVGVAILHPLILRRFAPQDELLGPANVITLSCKGRLPCRAKGAARRLPRLRRSGRSELQPTCRARAVRAARGGSPPGQRTGGFCQLVRTVSPL